MANLILRRERHRKEDAGSPVPRRASKRRTGARAEALTGWLFIAPFAVVFLLFTAIPTFLALAASFTDMSIRDIRRPSGIELVGFDTFARVLADASFQRSMLNTGLFVVLCVPLTMGIGLALALVLNRGIRRLRSVYRAAVYLPVVTNIVAAAVIWQYAFSISGPANSALGSIDLPQPNWLGEPGWAVATVTLMVAWRNIGTCMVLFLAGLQAIPEELYEAAATDGAGPFRRLRSLTLPLLRPTTLLVSVLMSIAFINIFEEPYLLTKGGPLSATQSMALWVYEQFTFGNVSQSMAGSIILLTLAAIVAAIQFRLLRPKH
jgi:multiple sugar transport system permease protein